MFNASQSGLGALDPTVALSGRELDQKGVPAEKAADYYEGKGVPLSPDIAYLIQLNRMLESRANQPQGNAAPSTVMQDLQRMAQGAPQQQMQPNQQQMQPNQQQMPQGSPQQQQPQQQQMDPRLASGIGQLPVDNVGTKAMASGGIVALGGGGFLGGDFAGTMGSVDPRLTASVTPSSTFSTLYPGVSAEELAAEIKSMQDAGDSEFKINRAKQALKYKLEQKIQAARAPAVTTEAGAARTGAGAAARNPFGAAAPELSPVASQQGLGSFRDTSTQNVTGRPAPTPTSDVSEAVKSAPKDSPKAPPKSTLSDIDAQNLARKRAADRAAMEAEKAAQEARWSGKGAAAAESAAAESGIMSGIKKSMPTLSRWAPKVGSALGKLGAVAAPLAVAGSALGAADSDAQSIQETSRLAQLGMDVDPNSKFKTGAATFAGLMESALPSSLFYKTPLEKAQKKTDKKLSDIEADGAKLVQRSPDDMEFAKQYQELRKTDPQAAEQLMQAYRYKKSTTESAPSAQEGIGGEAEKIAAARKATRQQAGKPANIPAGGVIPAEASNAVAAKVAEQAAPATASADPFMKMMEMIQANQDKYAERASSGVYNKAQDAYSKERQAELDQRLAAAKEDRAREKWNALSRAGFGAVGTGRNFVQTAANIGQDYTKSVQTMEEAKKALANSVSDAKAKLRESEALRADGQVEKADALQRDAQRDMMAIAGQAATYSQRERELAQTGSNSAADRASRERIAAGEQSVQLAGQNVQRELTNARGLAEQYASDQTGRGIIYKAYAKQITDLLAPYAYGGKIPPQVEAQVNQAKLRLNQIEQQMTTGRNGPALTMSPNGQLTGQ
jgi:hypothetical protein